MNPSEKSKRHDEANSLLDDICLNELREIAADGGVLTAAKLTAYTQRFGKSNMAKQQQEELLSQLKLVGGDVNIDEGTG